MAGDTKVAGSDGLSAAEFGQVARKHWLLATLCWAAVVLATLAWSVSQEKVYRADVLLRLDPDPPRPLGNRVELLGASGSGTYWNRKEFYESEYRVMRSMRIATAVVRSLGLHADAGFLHVGAKQVGATRPVSIEEAAEILIRRLSVEPIKDSSLAVLHYEDTDPKRCQAILSAVVRAYLNHNLEATSAVSTSALDWLNSQLDGLKTQLEKSEVALNDFRQKNNVLSISLEDRHNLISGQLEQIAKERTAVEVRRFDLAARQAELATVKGDDPLDAGASALLQSSVLNILRTSYAEQLKSSEELAAVYGDEHPKVLTARAKLASTVKSIRMEIGNIKAAALRDLRAVDRQIGELKKKEDEIQRTAHELQAFEVPYNQLTRTKNNNEKIYSLVLERARETDLTRVMRFNNVRVIDDAIEPRVPVRPNVPMNVALGVIGGLLLGLGVAVARELTDRSVKTPLDVESALGVACLGLLPQIEATDVQRGRRRQRPSVDLRQLSDRDLIVAAHPESGVAEAARSIRTNLTFMSPDRPFRSLLMTSALPQEGKTTVACSVATVLAQSGLRVLLIDTDLRRPRLHRTFKMSNDVGVTMAVSQQASLDECIRETAVPNLFVMTSGPIPPNPAELLQSERFRDLADEVKTKFDRVVFDSPPILPVTDAAILSQLVDGVAVVVRGYQTLKPIARQALRRLDDVNAHLIGVILNAIDLRRSDYRGYYYYGKSGYYQSDTD